MHASEVVWLDEYERRIAREPRNAKAWVEYAAKLPGDVDKFVVLSRGLRASPASALIWMELLGLREKYCGKSDEAAQQYRNMLVDFLVLFGDTKQYTWTKFFDVATKDAYEYAVAKNRQLNLVWKHYFDAFKHDKSVVRRYIEVAPECTAQVLRELSSEDALALANDLGSWDAYKILLESPIDEIREAALAKFPEHDLEIFTEWAKTNQGILVRGIEQAHSLETFDQLFERLLEVDDQFQSRRQLLRSNVAVRVEPTNPQIWLDRAELLGAGELQQGLEHVDADELWIALARAHAAAGDATKMREVFELATSRHPHHEVLWLAWIGLEPNVGDVVRLTKLAMTKNPRSKNLATASLRVATASETSALFEKYLKSRLLTMEGVKIAAQNLRESSDTSAQIWRLGAELFSWPEVGWLWTQAFDQFKNEDLNQLRNLFEAAIASNPPEDALCDIYLGYAKTEARRGSVALAKALLDEAPAKKEVVLLRAKLSTVSEFGSFEKVLSSVDDASANELAQELALELVQRSEEGAPDAARAFMEYSSQFNDPDTAAGREFWIKWAEFDGAAHPESFDSLKQRVARDFTKAAAEQNQIRFVQS